MAQQSISKQVADLLVTRDFHPEMKTDQGLPASAEDAVSLTFDYKSGSGRNYGTFVIVFDSDNDMKVFFGDNLGRSIYDREDKEEFFGFIQELHRLANRNRWTYTATDISKLKYTLQGIAAIKEGLFEGYYGTRRVSYSGEPTEARLVIQHSRPLGEGDARFRAIESIFIETADSERFRLQFKNLAGARAMLEHVRQGGRPYDIRGNHITEMVNQISTLSRFNRASSTRVLEGVTAELVTEAQHHYKTLKESIKRMSTASGYCKYFESWAPAEISLQEELVDSIKHMFIEQTLDARIEAALPLLAQLQQRKMKEAEIFESWADRLMEGTWALPESPEQQNRLKDLMSRELVVGPDGENASQQLYDLVGDDQLFDIINTIAATDPDANLWDNQEAINRLHELGIKLPEKSTKESPVDETLGMAVVGEGECNHTMEGEYCPKHGLVECSMHEADDPINYNAAITGSYYESKADPLVRLKSLVHSK